MITCNICQYSRPHSITIGLLECHLNPPQILISGNQVATMFPAVTTSMFCAQGKVDQDKRKEVLKETTHEQKTQ